MSSSKKLTCKGTLGQVFICLRPRTPYTLYVYTVYLFTHGRGEGRDLSQREGERGNSAQSCRKFPLQVNFFRWCSARDWE